MIVKMLHLDLVCLAAEKTATLEKLRDLGAVHLDLASAQGASVSAAKGEAADAERAVRLILKARGKSTDFDIHERTVAEVLSIDADCETLKAAKEELEREIRVYEPYGDFDPELAEKLLKEVDGLRDVAELPEKLPAMRLSKMHEKLDRIENNIRIDEDKLAGCDEKAILRKFPALADRIAFEEAKELVGESGELAYVSGWIPEPARGTFAAAAHEKGWGTLLREPADGEVPPTLVEPPKMFRPMKALFQGLGIAPAYTEADVSVPFMCYFSLFFAMLVGDGAYGAIFLLGTLAMRKNLPKSWFILLTVFSSATVLWDPVVRRLADGEVAGGPELPQHDAPLLHDRRVASDACADLERNLPRARLDVHSGVRLGGDTALHVPRHELDRRHIPGDPAVGLLGARRFRRRGVRLFREAVRAEDARR